MNRLSRSDQIVGGATLVLFISLFLPWFSVSAGGFSASADGLTSHGYLYIDLILALVILAYLVMVAGFAQLPFNLPLKHEQLLLVATSINLLLVLLGFLLKPAPGLGWSFGAFLGLIAAVVAVVPLAMPAIRARNASR